MGIEFAGRPFPDSHQAITDLDPVPLCGTTWPDLGDVEPLERILVYLQADAHRFTFPRRVELGQLPGGQIGGVLVEAGTGAADEFEHHERRLQAQSLPRRQGDFPCLILSILDTAQRRLPPVRLQALLEGMNQIGRQVRQIELAKGLVAQGEAQLVQPVLEEKEKIHLIAVDIAGVQLAEHLAVSLQSVR